MHDAEAVREGREALTAWAYLTFHHFLSALYENWESEFLSMAVLVYLTIYLRHKESAQSKAVDAPHDKTD